MKFLNKEINKSPLFGLNGSDTINSLRDEALNEFNKQGLPNKNWEEWKYSDFSSLNKISFAFGVRKNISSLPDSFPENNSQFYFYLILKGFTTFYRKILWIIIINS